MGNFASCTASLSSHKQASVPASVVPHTQLPAVRVLLIDGSMLKFRVPIKVIELLLDYPNHVICPLDSLKPGLHSLSSLLPNEKLQLGRLYLLLPFKAKSMQENCMKSKLAMQKRDSNKGFLQAKERELERKRLLPRDKSGMGFAGDVGHCGGDDNSNNKLQACGGQSAAHESQRSSKKKYNLDGKKSSEKQKNHDNKRRSEVGWGKCEELYENGEVGRKYIERRGSGAMRRSCGKLNADHDQSYNRAGRGMILRRATERYGKMQAENNDQYITASSDAGNGNGPLLCDTPELQRAYRSFLLRRSSSWTPRLQPILERR